MSAPPFASENSPDTFDFAESLLAQPERWPQLSESELAQLVSVASWLVAIRDAPGLDEKFDALYAYVVEHVDPGTRRQIVADLGEVLEAFGREHGTCPVQLLKPWLLSDPDAGVISTAALVAAQVMPLTDEDPLTGPKLLLGLAHEISDSDRQGAIVAGLAAFGEANVLALIDASWDALQRDARVDVLRRMGTIIPTVAALEFLVSALERAVDKGEEGPVGNVVGSLMRLRRGF